MRYCNVAIIGLDPDKYSGEPLFGESGGWVTPDMRGGARLSDIVEERKWFKPSGITTGDTLSCSVLLLTGAEQEVLDALEEWSRIDSYKDVTFDLVYTGVMTPALIDAFNDTGDERKYLTSLFSISPESDDGYRISENEIGMICYGILGERVSGRNLNSGFFFVSLAVCDMGGYPILPEIALSRLDSGERPRVASIKETLDAMLKSQVRSLPTSASRYLSLCDAFDGRGADFPGTGELKGDYHEYLRRYVTINVLPPDHDARYEGSEFTERFLERLRLPPLSGEQLIGTLYDIREDLIARSLEGCKEKLRAASVGLNSVEDSYFPARSFWDWADIAHREYIARLEELVRCEFMLRMTETIIQDLAERIKKYRDDLEDFKARQVKESSRATERHRQVCRAIDGILPPDFNVPFDMSGLRPGRDRSICRLLDTSDLAAFLNGLYREAGFIFEEEQISELLTDIREVFKRVMDRPVFTQPFPYDTARNRLDAGIGAVTTRYIVPECKYARKLIAPNAETTQSIDTMAKLDFYMIDSTNRQLKELYT